MIPFGGQLNADGSHEFPVRVYFEDTDFSTNVYHAAYLKFFERARTEFLRAYDIHHNELAKDGLAFAVREMQISYDRAAHIDDLLVVLTQLSEVSGARFILSQSIDRESERICAARVVAVLLNQAGRPARLPKEMRAKLLAN